ncbi:hypothetical protein C6Y14_27220 [Streptomyces dioscori]|uniref:SDR family NAD(P)-dependent oxidoreductase n=1 Tax=Streptomyces dioscori TaxID=2109333 RepID=A0A2P8Q2B2_9ACTN|nr:hypothetical protein C6Y14_27220 [Streptomyces dioscori]
MGATPKPRPVARLRMSPQRPCRDDGANLGGTSRTTEPRTIVLTGASSGIGLAAAEQIAAQGNRGVLVGRDERRPATAVDRLRAVGRGSEPGYPQADFERLADVRALADHLLSTYPRSPCGRTTPALSRRPTGTPWTATRPPLRPTIWDSFSSASCCGKDCPRTGS